MPDFRTKSFTYFRVRYGIEPFNQKFQDILKRTFDGTTVKDRIYKTSEDAPYYEFINQVSNMKGFFCANLYGYEDGKASQIIKANFDKEYIETKMFEAGQDSDGTKLHFLEGKAYFICFEDHFILCGDARIGSKALEIYLNDRIRERHHGLPIDFRITLERAIPQQTRRKIKNVKKVEISSMLPGDASHGQSSNVALVQSSKRIQQRLGLNRVAELMSTLFGADVNLDDFSTKGIIQENEIQVTVSLKWANRQRNESTADQLDAFANTFRHVEDQVDVKIDAGSATYSGKELKLTDKKSVKHHDDMPVFEDICDKMITWYEKLNAEQQI